MTHTISKSKLKAKMLEVFREVEATGQEIIVTAHNKPVLKITPIKVKTGVSELFGSLQGQVKYLGDINEPTLMEWDEA